MKQFFIDILAFTTLLSSVLVITSKNPITAVLFLISVFVNSAGYLILKGIGFIGISYIIVYVGAITVLFLFVIMMVNIKLEDITESGSQYAKNIPLALAIGSLFLYEIFSIIPFTFKDASFISTFLDSFSKFNGLLLNSNILSSSEVFNTFNPVIADGAISSFTQMEALGHLLYTYNAIWLIIISMILLLAMIAAIFVSAKNKISNPITHKTKIEYTYKHKHIKIGNILVRSAVITNKSYLPFSYIKFLLTRLKNKFVLIPSIILLNNYIITPFFSTQFPTLYIYISTNFVSICIVLMFLWALFLCLYYCFELFIYNLYLTNTELKIPSWLLFILKFWSPDLKNQSKSQLKYSYKKSFLNSLIFHLIILFAIFLVMIFFVIL